MTKRESMLQKLIKIFFKVVFGRTIITAFILMIQIFVLFASFKWLGNYLHFILEGFTLLGAILIVYIVNKEMDASFKMAWIIPICVIPVFGALLYLFVSLNPGTSGLRKSLSNRIKETAKYRNTTESVKVRLEGEEVGLQQLSHYIERVAGYPTYNQSDATYFPLGEDNFKDILMELEKAEKFIFLEYFIVERGIMWNSILEILKKKVEEGVEVRVMYDGMCSLVLLPYKYPKQLEKFGIKAKMFSPIIPILSTHQNNRDHRKILVIDGRVAYTGGVNLADEYINKKDVFGHWKDVAVKLDGDAVKSFTIMFLEMWNVSEKGTEDYQVYLQETIKKKAKEHLKSNQGYFIPYGDGPTKKESIAENVYIDMLYQAKEYVHIMTPYLILDDEMLKALTYTALRGVEVNIILPHIPDKKIPFHIARTYYPTLMRAGVKIYEYTPGFIHAKLFVSDNRKAVVGTINLDFRSLYLHFECGVYIYDHPVIQMIEKDYQDTLLVSQEATLDYFKNLPVLSRLSGRVCRLFAPLM